MKKMMILLLIVVGLTGCVSNESSIYTYIAEGKTYQYAEDHYYQVKNAEGEVRVYFIGKNGLYLVEMHDGQYFNTDQNIINEVKGNSKALLLKFDLEKGETFFDDYARKVTYKGEERVKTPMGEYNTSIYTIKLGAKSDVDLYFSPEIGIVRYYNFDGKVLTLNNIKEGGK